MRTIAAERHTPRADLTSRPKALDWAVYVRENVKLTSSARSLALLLITLGQGQNITMSIVGMADSIGMKRTTVRAALDELMAKGLVVIDRPGKNRKNVYRLTLPVPQVGTEGDHQDGSIGDHQGGTEGDHQVVPKGTTTSREDEEKAEQLTSTSGRDDVDGRPTAQPKGKDRAKGSSRGEDDSPVDLPGVDDYISDIQGCVDELARRLEMPVAQINIKVLARKWRELCARYEDDRMVSDLIAQVPADEDVWSEFASKDSPVGYLLDTVDRTLAEDATESNYERQAS